MKKKSNIKTDPRNARIHDSRNKGAINASLLELGPGRSILIDSEYVVMGGNGVFAEAEALGIPVRVIDSDGSELIAIRRTDLKTDDAKRKALALADNRCSDLSLFDDETVSALLAECDKLQFSAGFTPEEAAALLDQVSIFDDLVENNFTNSIKAMSDVFSVTFVFPKDSGVVVTEFIKRNGKPELTKRLIEFCRRAVS